MTTLHRITRADIVAETIAIHRAVAVNPTALPALIANPSNHFIMDDQRRNLFIFVWTGPGVYNLMFSLTNDALLLPAIIEAVAYIRAQGGKILWAAERPEDAGSVFGMKAFGMRDTGKTALVAEGVRPIWRRGLA